MTTIPCDDRDRAFVAAALELARRGLGIVWPNPAVGCILVRPDLGHRIVGRGWTQPGGRPHAETEALRRAGEGARGATAYVTLEPCSHQGKTPPCADALVKAGVSRAVIAIEDPDPRVSGRGIARLREAGVSVEVGEGAETARQVNAGFLSRIIRGRPLVTVKVAATLDGRIATATGESRWITGDAARAYGHGLRARHDAIAVGIGTVLADDPDLTCRLPGLATRSPLRIVFDSSLRLPLASRVVATARETPTWVLCCEKADAAAREALTAAGVVVIQVAAGGDGRPDMPVAFAELARRGLTRVLVEGGGQVIAAVLKAGLGDRLAWFRASRILGGDAVPAVAGMGIAALAEAPAFERAGMLEAGPDVVELFRRKE